MTVNEQTQPVSTWETFKKEGAAMLNTLGDLIDQAANDLSKLTIVSLELDQRQKIDSLVNAGIVKNRGSAVRYLVTEGIKSKKELFEKIERTNMEIQTLKDNLGKNFASQKVE